MGYKFNLLCFSLCCCLMAATAPRRHPIHMAVTELQLNPGSQSLEVSHKIFADDFEAVIYRTYQVKLALGTNKQHPEAKKYIADYLTKHFVALADGKKLTFSLLGWEPEQQAIWIYAEAQPLAQCKKLEITNSILMDLYDDQRNFVHLSYREQKKSLRMQQDEITGVLSLD